MPEAVVNSGRRSGKRARPGSTARCCQSRRARSNDSLLTALSIGSLLQRADRDELGVLVDLVALADVEGQDLAVARGADLVLHLHGREDDQPLAALDDRAGLDLGPDDLAGHGRPDDRLAGLDGRLALDVGQAALPLVLDDGVEE